MISCRFTCSLSSRGVWLFVALALAVLVLVACRDVGEGGAVVGQQDLPEDWDKRAEALGLTIAGS